MFQKYKVISMLGEGGDGKVYKVWDSGLHRFLAVKETNMTEEQLRRLEELAYPLFPTMIDAFREKEKNYIVMEYVEGMNLQEYMEKRGRLSQEEGVAIGLQLIQALQFLHEIKPTVVYRDMKPANVILKRDGTIKLIDFDTAFFESEEGTDKLRPAGTPGYASPEQLSQETYRYTDVRSDIYSLGATLHYMLTGKNPCEPPYEFRAIREYDRAISKGLEKVILRCLQKNPEQRYQSTAEMRKELEHYKIYDKKAQIVFQVQKLLYLILLALGTYVLYQSLRKEEFLQEMNWLRILTIGSIFCTAWVWRKVMLDKPWKHRTAYRCEKSVWKTTKKYRGLSVMKEDRGKSLKIDY